MNDLIRQVTPQTAAIVWFVPEGALSNSSYYADIDYLLDGLLTANLKVSEITSGQVIVGQNYGKSIYVMIINEAKSNEINSFISLFKKDMTTESDVIVIDEKNVFEGLKKEFKEISNHIRTYQK